MEALCPGRDQCSLAVYLSGLQQVITGLGTLIVTPLIGNLSDRYGRKALLTLPMMIAIIPLVIECPLFAQIRSIVSKKVGPCEQGMAQGCITGIGSFATIISPLVFTPLTAWFLSEDAPFKFKGFSIMCAGFASLIAFMLSIMMRAAPPTTSQKLVNAIYVQA
ncbi:hypothetical protein COCNU_07G015010 [Cocos nucifera]|uniref:Uncharacterized protein n=1 Tax=Cocos nucifera TaxID=13894 RepID=A0A8K0IGW7_COCNU|nr:hypothetical protein COCNU_07G015010 [Cocos nucifera]